MVASSDSPAFTVLLILSCTPDDADFLIGELRALVEKRLSSEPGFVSATLYVNEERTEVVTLTTWQERRHFEAFWQEDDMRTRALRGLERHPRIHFLRVVAQAKA